MENQIRNLPQSVEMPTTGILSIPIVDNEYYKVVLFMMPKGQYLSPHTSSMAATVQILGGEAEFTLGDKAHEVKPGDFFFMPPGENHAIDAREDFVFLLTLRK